MLANLYWLIDDYYHDSFHAQLLEFNCDVRVIDHLEILKKQGSATNSALCCRGDTRISQLKAEQVNGYNLIKHLPPFFAVTCVLLTYSYCPIMSIVSFPAYLEEGYDPQLLRDPDFV